MPIFGEGSNEKEYSQLLSELTAHDKDADYIDHSNPYPFLHTAVKNNNLQGLRAVIDYYRKKYPQQKTLEKYSFKEAINLPDKDGNTALHYACRFCNLEFVKILMDAKADDKIADAANNLPLHIAVEKFKADIVEYLLTKRQLNYLLSLLGVDSTDSNNTDDNIQEAKCNAVNNAAFTPLLMAVYLHTKNAEDEINNEKIIIALLNKYSPIQFDEDSGNSKLENSSYLHVAINRRLSFAVISKIVQKIPQQLNAKNVDGQTALHCAVILKDKVLIKLLLENSINPFELDKSGKTALHLAAERRYLDPEILELLLDYYKEHGKVDYVGTDGKTPFHIAASHCDEDIAQLFIDYGANVNASDLEGNTPVHRAAIALTKTSKVEDSIKHQRTFFYLDYYADRTITNSESKTANEIFKNFLNTPLDNELSVVDLDDRTAEPDITDVTTHGVVTQSHTLMVARLTPISIDTSTTNDIATSPSAISGRSESGSSTKPFLPTRILNNSKGLLERLNNYRMSVWRKCKTSAIGRFVRRHPYISAAIFTIALTGLVALCVFAAPVAAKIAILTGVKIALTKMKILPATSRLLEPIAQTVAMLLPTIGVAIVGAAIKFRKYWSPCSTPPKVATEISVSNSAHSPQSKNDRSPKSPKLQAVNDRVVIMPRAKPKSFSFRDYLPSCFFSCFERCDEQRRKRANSYEIIIDKEKERRNDAAASHGGTVENSTFDSSTAARAVL